MAEKESLAQRGLGFLGFAILILVAAMVIAAIYFLVFVPQQAPPVEVTKIELTPNKITSDQVAVLTVTLENRDRKDHVVTIKFEADPEVVVYDPQGERIQRQDTICNYTFKLSKELPSMTQTFNIGGELGKGKTAATCIVRVYVICDGEKIKEYEATLSIEK